MTFVFVKGSTILGTGETIAEVAQACGTALRPLVYKIEGPWRPEAFYLRDGRLRLHPGAEGWILPYGRYTPELRDDHPPLSGASLRALETIATRSRILGTEVHHATAEVLLRAGPQVGATRFERRDCMAALVDRVQREHGEVDHVVGVGELAAKHRGEHTQPFGIVRDSVRFRGVHGANVQPDERLSMIHSHHTPTLFYDKVPHPMRDELLKTLGPVLLALFTAGCGWVARSLTRYLARRTYNLDCEALRATARSVVADLEVAVEAAKDPLRDGVWSIDLAGTTRLKAIERLRILSPLAVKNVLTSLDGDASALDALLGAYVEEALRDLRANRARASTPK